MDEEAVQWFDPQEGIKDGSEALGGQSQAKAPPTPGPRKKKTAFWTGVGVTGSGHCPPDSHSFKTFEFQRPIPVLSGSIREIGQV